LISQIVAATPTPVQLTDAQRQAAARQIEVWAQNAQANLDAANATIAKQNADADTLQVMVNNLAVHDASETAKAAALAKQIRAWKAIVAAEAGALALFLCLYFKLPYICLPYGIIATFAAGPLVFGLLMLL
jgi:hypothetical protein